MSAATFAEIGAEVPYKIGVMVETPVKLSSEQRDMLRKFDQSLKTDDRRHSPREEGFFEGVKRFFTNAES